MGHLNNAPDFVVFGCKFCPSGAPTSNLELNKRNNILVLRNKNKKFIVLINYAVRKFILRNIAILSFA